MRAISGGREQTGQEELNDRMKLQMKGFIVDYYDLGGGSDDKDSLFQQHVLIEGEKV